ncbi:hypothetical protein EV183_002707 [Coemansia sp. RSA 2336]|nr:hypothetical protein EV183_002707 [Coemansia sp. RSA 2336]
MEIKDFAAESFDVNDWVNAQFKDVDDIGADKRAQRLATQLQILATAAQQNSERVKARMRHQAAQMSRDVAALAKLVRAAQTHASILTQAVDAQAAGMPAIARIAEAGASVRKADRIAAALDAQQQLETLPQRVEELVAAQKLTLAWDAVDAAGSASVAVECLEQIRKATVAEVARAAAAGDAGAAADAVRALADHGYADAAESEVLRVRVDVGTKQLQELESLSVQPDIREVLHQAAAAIAADREFVTAAGVSAAVLPRLVEQYVHAVQPAVERSAADAQRRSDTQAAAELLSALNAFSGTTSTVAGPDATSPLLAAAAGGISGLGIAEASRIRDGSLQQLQQVAYKTGHASAFVRVAVPALEATFVDVAAALGRVTALAPAAGSADAVASVTTVIQDMVEFVQVGVTGLARRAGIDASDLAKAADLAATIRGDMSGIAFQPITDERKPDIVACAAAYALLSALIAERAHVVLKQARVQWDQYAQESTGQAEDTVKLAQDTVAPQALSDVEAAANDARRTAAAAVLFMMTAVFRAPLAREVQAINASGDSDTQQVLVQFSSAPSENVVDLGERMHMLLPELEQAESLYMQLSRGVEQAPVSLYSDVAHYFGSEGEDPLPAMLTLVLSAVQRALVAYVSRLEPPLSAQSLGQLRADVEYVASVAAAFESALDPRFAELQSWLHADTVSSDILNKLQTLSM